MSKKKAASGHVYLLSHALMPVVKVGRTCNPTVRLDQLYSRGVPPGLRIERVWSVPDAKAAEEEIFAQLEPFRVSRKREFFHLPTADAIDTLEAEFGSSGRPRQGLRTVPRSGVPLSLPSGGPGEIAVVSNRWMLPTMVVAAPAISPVVKSLFATGVPERFVVEAAWTVADLGVAGAAVFGALAQYRLAPDREFFNLSSHQAARSVECSLRSAGLRVIPVSMGSPKAASAPKRSSWLRRLRDVEAFILANGRLPSTGRTAAADPVERSLRDFIDRQRHKHRRGQLPAAQASALEAVFRLDTLPNGRERMLDRLDVFVTAKRRLPTRATEDRNEHMVASWMLNQIEGDLSGPERRELEDVIDKV